MSALTRGSLRLIDHTMRKPDGQRVVADQAKPDEGLSGQRNREPFSIRGITAS
jgi:hypothetical protein